MTEQNKSPNYVYFEKGTKNEKESILNSNQINTDNDNSRFAQIEQKMDDNSCVIL